MAVIVGIGFFSAMRVLDECELGVVFRLGKMIRRLESDVLDVGAMA